MRSAARASVHASNAGSAANAEVMSELDARSRRENFMGGWGGAKFGVLADENDVERGASGWPRAAGRTEARAGRKAQAKIFREHREQFVGVGDETLLRASV